MCGISGIVGEDWTLSQLNWMVRAQNHRGPDDNAVFVTPHVIGLGHNRLSIIDLKTGAQPMESEEGNLVIVYNGEVYNYLELRAELSDYPFQTQSDTEVILAAFQKWGAGCLDKFIGMFAFAVWNKREQSLFLARDRFGVKPLYYAFHDGCLYFASEIKALFEAGLPKYPDEDAWANYLALGRYDDTPFTFWAGIFKVKPGEYLVWQDSKFTAVVNWYDLADKVQTQDRRSIEMVKDEYLALARDAVKIRFRSDVPVGVNLSGGLDSSVLLALVDEIKPGCDVFTFGTGTGYDEARFIEPYLGNHTWRIWNTFSNEVINLAKRVQKAQDEPYGGIPTICYSRLFERARATGTIVLIDGNGMDEQWAGYDYYAKADGSLIQGSRDKSTRPDCLLPAFRELAESAPQVRGLRNMQVRDITQTKLPKALRFNDRISAMHSTELRSPFMDHRLIELALRQPNERKIKAGTHKWMLREIAKELLPAGVVHAPKRPVQTPQREWLRKELAGWVEGEINTMLERYAGRWFDRHAVYTEWDRYQVGTYDNSFFVWQWVSLGMTCES